MSASGPNWFLRKYATEAPPMPAPMMPVNKSIFSLKYNFEEHYLIKVVEHSGDT